MPFAPAGGTDILARLLGEKLEQALGKPFVVENRPGAGTVLATNFVAKSPADGYTIMMSVSSLAIDATLYKTLPYDPGKDLALVALVAFVPFILVVNPSLPVSNVEDLIKLAKTKPLSYGSGGVGAFHHLARRAVRQHDRHQDDPRALSRHGAGAQRPDGRLYPAHVRGSRSGAAADQGGQSPSRSP